jgi:chaperone required for assembly of F1-ATPase
MSEWAAKRFWTSTEVVAEGDGFSVRLDGRPVRTPAKKPLIVPTRVLAEEIAGEWQAQEKVVKPSTMPVTRTANSAIDKVAVQRTEIIDILGEYGGTDLLCYRATGPQELIARQAAAWDPLLDWAETALGARLKVTQGVLPIAQNPPDLARLSAQIVEFSDFELAAFHDLVALPGSLVIGLAVTFGQKSPEALWEIARLDELWQIEQWGEDEEAEATNRLKKQAFLDAARFFRLAQ